MKTCSKPNIALLCSPGLGHLIPVSELAGHLAGIHGFSVTVLANPSGPSASAPYHALADTLRRANVDLVTLPDPPANAFPADAEPVWCLVLKVKHNLAHVREVLRKLAPVVLIIDILSYPALDMAAELGVPCYVFFTSSCMCTSFSFHLPGLAETYHGEYKDMPEQVHLPGSVPVWGIDLFPPAYPRSSQAYELFLHLSKRLIEAKGILVNSFAGLEPGAVTALKNSRPGRPPVYPVGPLVRSGETEPGSVHDECLKWLDRQPDRSVVYVSFGSAAVVTCQQTAELALGLEASGLRFLWAVKSPVDWEANGEDPWGFLPMGFVERTKGRGSIITSWAPQVPVLRHASVGGFLTHCGWNSAMESVVAGVPMIACPLYAEQRMNAVLLEEGARVAVRVKEGEDGFVGREEIARAVKSVMEGEEGKSMRERISGLKDEALHALSEDGSSSKELLGVAQQFQASMALAL